MIAFLAFVASASCFGAARTALDRYVAQPDPHYRYELVSTIPGEDCKTFVLRMTSQSWRTSAEVDRPVWQHWLVIVEPRQVRSSTGLLFISGGSNGGRPPAKVDPMLRELAVSTNTVAAEVRMVPNEPLTFAGESRRRTEDGIVAYTWDKFLRTGDATWLARLPMTKAAVRAMDTVTAFCASAQGGGVNVGKFVVTGASKRGWTTWTTAAVDPRVVAIAPIVIDVLNVEKSFEHHYRAYGFWAPAVGDYVQMDIMRWMGTPQFRELQKVVDPYSYRSRLTMPKYIVNAAGDQFFVTDSWQFYYGGLKGEKYLRYVPNADHSLRRSDAIESLEAWYGLIVGGQPRPRFGWKIEKEGAIRVRTVTRPDAVKLWQATDPDGRDFRLEKIGPAWRSFPLVEEGRGTFVARVPKPQKGFTAYFVELTYPGIGRHTVKFTTGTKIVPDVLPFEAPRLK